MLLDIDRLDPEAIAAKDSRGDSLTYGEIIALGGRLRTELPARSLMFILTENTVGGCLDYMIFLHCIQGFPDNANKNVIWSTYDGAIWSPNAYDLDTTWGMAWDGQMYVFEGNPINYASGGFWSLPDSGESWAHANLRGNDLFEAMLLFYADEAEARYKELRADGGPLSYANVEKRFTEFISGIPEVLYQREATDFPTRPSQMHDSTAANYTCLEDILSYAQNLLAHFDTLYCGDGVDTLGFNQAYFNN